MAQAWDKGNITSSHKPSHPSSRITSGSHGDGRHGSHGMVKKKKKNTLRSERSEGKLSRQMTSVTPAIVSDDDLDISIRSGIHHTHTYTHTMSCITLFTTSYVGPGEFITSSRNDHNNIMRKHNISPHNSVAMVKHPNKQTVSKATRKKSGDCITNLDGVWQVQDKER